MTYKLANEKLIEKNLREKVKSLGGWAIKFWPVTLSGFPDRIVLMPPGRAWFVELKSTGKDFEEHQRSVKKKLIKLGFKVYRINTKELLNDFLKMITDDIQTS